MTGKFLYPNPNTSFWTASLVMIIGLNGLLGFAVFGWIDAPDARILFMCSRISFSVSNEFNSSSALNENLKIWALVSK